MKNSLSEDEVEELCDRLEIKRHELYREIIKKLDSSANLSFYPSRTAPVDQTKIAKYFLSYDTPYQCNQRNNQRYKLIAILRRQYHIILIASWEKIYSVLGGVANLWDCF